MPTKVLGIAGSLRERSTTLRVIRLTLDAVRAAGGEPLLLDLCETPLPMFNPDHKTPGAAYDQVRGLVLWADAFVLGSPDYHGAMSSAMKNFLDYFWQEFMGKLFGYVVSSHEKGLTVQDQMRTAVRQCYGWSLPYGIGFNGNKDFESSGAPSDWLAQRIKMLGRDLVVYGGLLHTRFRADLASLEHGGISFAQFYKG